MLINLLTGLPVILFCLVLQALFISWCLRAYLRFRPYTQASNAVLPDILRRRGYGEAAVRGVMGGNFLRLAEEIWT